MRKENIRSPFVFVRLAEWNILRYLLATGKAREAQLLRLPHTQYINRPDIILQLSRKGLIVGENKTEYTPEEALLRSIFEEDGGMYLLTPAGKALVKSGLRLVKKFGRMGIDITIYCSKPDSDPESE